MARISQHKAQTAAATIGLISSPFLYLLAQYLYDELQWRRLERKASYGYNGSKQQRSLV